MSDTVLDTLLGKVEMAFLADCIFQHGHTHMFFSKYSFKTFPIEK